MPFFLVLRQAEKWQQTHNETRSLIPDILDQLGEYNVKLTDMQGALEQAVDYIRKTEAINQENAAKLHAREVLSSTLFSS